jgi:hypothetical protein
LEYSVVEHLRDRLHQEAREAVLRFANDDDILAAILIGSAAWGKPNPDGDIDILLITRGRTGVVYRYLIPGFCDVARRTELGYVPREVVLDSIKQGYRTVISCNLIEQLKNGKVLSQHDDQGDILIAAAQRVRPGGVVIGKTLHDLSAVVKQEERHIAQGRYEEATLMVSRIVRLAVQALLLAREGTGIAKEKHEYRAVRKHLNKYEVGAYEELMRVEGAGRSEGRRVLSGAIELIKWVLEGRNLSPKLVDYDGSKRGTEGNAVQRS